MNKPPTDRTARAAAQDILSRLALVRIRCERRAKSFATPMGDKMFYRYQQSLMDNTTAVLKRLLRMRPPATIGPN
jgi:hypothetical protein